MHILQTTGLVFSASDVARFLGLPAPESVDEAPGAVPGTVTVHCSFSLKELWDRIPVHLRKDLHWRHTEDFQNVLSDRVFGYYRVRLPIPDSGAKTLDEQQTMLGQGEQIANPTVVASALACLVLAGQNILDAIPMNQELGAFFRSACFKEPNLGIGIGYSPKDNQLIVGSGSWVNTPASTVVAAGATST